MLRTSMSILNLSVELILEITSWAPSNQKHLRAVCRYLNFAIAPLFFSSVTLDIHQSRLKLGLSQLETLATGEAPWSHFARTLVIKHLAPSHKLVQNDAGATDAEIQLADTRLRILLRPALDSMQNLRTVKWTSSDKDAHRTTSTVADFLSSLPLLEDLQLKVNGPSFNCSLDRLSGLRKLSLTCRVPKITQSMSLVVSKSPNLDFISLALEDGHTSCNDLFRDVSPAQHLHITALHLTEYSLQVDGPTLRHLRSLKSLWYRDFSRSNDQTAHQMWDALRHAKIHLTDIHVTHLTEGLLRYLSLYAGLEQLVITSAGGASEAESNRRADDFFERALPRHADSLVSLSCFAVMEGRWSIGMHNVGGLAQLHKLRSLRMSVNTVDAGLGAPRGGRGRAKLVAIESDQDGRNTVHLFLELLERSPSIRQAAILPAVPERLRNATCGNPITSHRFGVIGKIDAAVCEFSSPTASSAVVLAGHNYYAMKSGVDGILRYHAIESANLVWPYSYTRLFPWAM
ncbi:hypothetical protein DFH09DRAFT_1030371 [Mycena vulgaris]|nr:hypothetical protein DFH09DRAFT_1030371 [Mycena vulgaris]